MSSELKLVVRTGQVITQLGCIFCGKTFESPDRFVLYDGDTPAGYVCPQCLEAGPRRVASQLQRHAEDLRTLAARANTSLPLEKWLGPIEGTHERAEYWTAIAERIAHLTGWPLEKSAEAQTSP